MTANHRDLLGAGRHRQQTALVLQQHDGLLFRALGDLAIGFGVEPAGLHRMVEHADREQAAQIAVRHLPHPLLGDATVLHRGL
jgi:hypothetical protein